MADETINESTVRRLAALAALQLTAEDATRMAAELTQIVRHIDQLKAVDVSDVPPTVQVLGRDMPMRQDVTRPSLSQEQALDQAPHTQASGFAVPSYVDEG